MKLDRWSIGDVAGTISAGLLCVLVIVSVFAVGMRYLAGDPLAWGEEFSILVLLWLIMSGAVYAKRKDSMLRMDIVYNLLPVRLRHILDVAQELVHCALFGLMIFYGYKLAAHAGAKTMSLLAVPMFWLYISLPVGAAGLLLMSLSRLWGMAAGKREE